MILLFEQFSREYCIEYSHQKVEDMVNLLELMSDHMQSTTTSFLFFSAILLLSLSFSLVLERKYMIIYTFYVFINVRNKSIGKLF